MGFWGYGDRNIFLMGTGINNISGTSIDIIVGYFTGLSTSHANFAQKSTPISQQIVVLSHTLNIGQNLKTAGLVTCEVDKNGTSESTLEIDVLAGLIGRFEVIPDVPVTFLTTDLICAGCSDTGADAGNFRPNFIIRCREI